MWRIAYGLAIIAALAGLGGCDSLLPPRSCPQAGCEDGLIVELSAMPSAPFRIEVRVSSPTSQPAYVFECQSTAPCGPGAFFPGFSAERAFVTVVTANGSRTTEIPRIEYRVTRPNGPVCPPECRQARVTANVPA
jgi:hypothetical protein